MPRTINEAKFRDQTSYDVSQPDVLEGGQGKGIPVIQIPHMEFPRVVYLHPKEPWRKIEHRNKLHEIVDVETVPAEHLTRSVADAKELAAAIKDGWLKDPYVTPPMPDPNANLYK